MEAGRHLGRDDDAEGRDDGVNVACVFAAGIEEDVFAAKANQIDSINSLKLESFRRERVKVKAELIKNNFPRK